MAFGKRSKKSVSPASNTDLARQHIFDSLRAGKIGVATMNLYDIYGARAANAAIRNMLADGAITISSPVTGTRCKSPSDYGVAQALKTKNYDVQRA